jgi:hypothetical protein
VLAGSRPSGNEVAVQDRSWMSLFGMSLFGS